MLFCIQTSDHFHLGALEHTVYQRHCKDGNFMLITLRILKSISFNSSIFQSIIQKVGLMTLFAKIFVQ